jgi:hypothetical protein
MYLVMSPGGGSTPRQSDWLTANRNVTLTPKIDRYYMILLLLQNYAHN